MFAGTDAAGAAAVAGAGDAAARAGRRRGRRGRSRRKQALVEAFGHRSYVLLVLGFFTCGFQLAFVTVHLPSYLLDRGLGADIGAWTIAFIGLFNIVGSLGVGLARRAGCPSAICCRSSISRARLSIVAFIAAAGEHDDDADLRRRHRACSGSRPCRRPPGLVALMFGTRWLTMLFGFAFFSHQVGGFLGVWLGGLAFETTGSYDLVWWLSVFFGVASAVINLPIVEKPVARPAVAAAAQPDRPAWPARLSSLAHAARHSVLRLPDRR